MNGLLSTTLQLFTSDVWQGRRGKQAYSQVLHPARLYNGHGSGTDVDSAASAGSRNTHARQTLPMRSTLQTLTVPQLTPCTLLSCMPEHASTRQLIIMSSPTSFLAYLPLCRCGAHRLCAGAQLPKPEARIAVLPSCTTHPLTHNELDMLALCCTYSGSTS